MQACTGISTCAVLTPSLREDFFPKHKDNVGTLQDTLQCTTEAMASGYTSARVDKPVCTMPARALLSLRKKPGCTWAGEELRCSKDAGRDVYGSRPVRCAGELTAL